MQVRLGDIVVRAHDRARISTRRGLTSVEDVIDDGIATIVKDDEGQLVLWRGFRAYKATKQLAGAGWEDATIAADVFERAPYELWLASVMARLDRGAKPDPITVGLGLKELVSAGMRQSTIAVELRFTSGYVSQHLSMLQFPEPVRLALSNGDLLFTTARLLLPLRHEPDVVLEVFQEMRARALDRHAIETLVSRLRTGKRQRAARNRSAS